MLQNKAVVCLCVGVCACMCGCVLVCVGVDGVDGARLGWGLGVGGFAARVS